MHTTEEIFIQAKRRQIVLAAALNPDNWVGEPIVCADPAQDGQVLVCTIRIRHPSVFPLVIDEQ